MVNTGKATDAADRIHDARSANMSGGEEEGFYILASQQGCVDVPGKVPKSEAHDCSEPTCKILD